MKVVAIASVAVLACALLSAGAASSRPVPVAEARAASADVAAEPMTRPSRFRILVGSSRDGKTRAYSIRPDGSRLTPLLRRSRALEPLDVSGDGRTVVYTDNRYPNTIYVSRADGTGLHRVVRGNKRFSIDSAVLSRDGKRVAFTTGYPRRIFVVGANGRSRERVASGSDPDWSPDGRALVFVAEHRGHCAVVVQQLRGRRRVLAPRACYLPRWSPNGRWIAYETDEPGRKVGLWVVRPNGTRRHRVAPSAEDSLSPYSWSPDGRSLAYTDFFGVSVVGVSGRPRRLHLDITPTSILSPTVAWSPDGSRLTLSAHADDDPDQIWLVGRDGRGLRRLTNAGANNPVGWTRLAPVLPPAAPIPPNERVLGPSSVATNKPVAALSADGERVAFVPSTSASDCEHVSVWTPATKSILRVSQHFPAPCSYRGETGTVGYGIYELALAGTRVAWSDIEGCGNNCDVAFTTATLPGARPLLLGEDSGGGGAGGGDLTPFNPRGHGDLLVFNYGDGIVRVDAQCGTAKKCKRLRTGAHTYPVASVSQHLIAVRERSAVAVLDENGSLVNVLPFGDDEVKAALLDGGRLLIATSTVLQLYDAASGAPQLQRPLPTGYVLTDIDDGIAVLRHGKTILLLRLDDGRSLTLVPGRGPVAADLEPAGLYYSYATSAGGGRIVFVPRSDLERQLGSNAH